MTMVIPCQEDGVSIGITLSSAAVWKVVFW